MLEAIGGIGLFLLGMIIMTDGLRALTGHSLRNALMRFTRSPLSGAITGATTTAILQSSSATTVAAIGFVGAGLMTFPAALGIIFGANIGTTMTGWIVALLGLKLKLGTIMLPVILIGVILKLFGKGRIAIIGYAIAGFGLIFVGITMMQTGMSGLQGYFTPEMLPTNTIFDILLLVLLGIISTIITQSSSAGVAAALTAVYTGTLQLDQAMALVIGMDVGTTVTAALATIGGSTESRRTGLSHVIFNIFTAIGAIILIAPYLYIWETWLPDQLSGSAEIALVAFHTTFNLLGVLIVLPFASRFARFIQGIIKSKELIYTENLDNRLLKEPAVALTAIKSTLKNEVIDLLYSINQLLGGKTPEKEIHLKDLKSALEQTHTYIDMVHLSDEPGKDYEAMLGVVHAMDHINRLYKRCTETHRASVAKSYDKLATITQRAIESNNHIIHELHNNQWYEASVYARTENREIVNVLEDIRSEIMKEVAADIVDVPDANDYLEAVRWLNRVGDHIERITLHLASGTQRQFVE